MVQQHLQHGLLLDVAARGAERHLELAVAQQHRRRGREPRPLAGRDHALVCRIEPALRAAPGHYATDAGDGRRVHVGIARRRGKAVAVRVDDGHVRRVERFVGATRDGGGRSAITRGRHLAPRAVANQRATLGGVGLGQQHLGRHVDDVRIAVIRLALGKRDLHRLRDEVQIGRRVVAECRQIRALEQVEHLQQDRALTPEAAHAHLPRAPRADQRALDLDLERREIIQRQRALLGTMEFRDALGGLAAIELVACRANSRGAAAAGALLRARHPAERVAQLRLHEPLAHAEWPPVVQVERGRRRPATIFVGVGGQLIRGEAGHGKAAACVLGGRRRDVREGHRPPAFERPAPGRRRRGHDGARQPRRDLVAEAPEVLEGRRARIRAHARDLKCLPRAREVHQDRRDAGDAHHIGVDDAQREARGNSGVDRVAAGAQHVGRRLGGERVAGRDGPARADGLHGGGRTVRGRTLLGGGGIEAHGRDDTPCGHATLAACPRL